MRASRGEQQTYELYHSLDRPGFRAARGGGMSIGVLRWASGKTERQAKGNCVGYGHGLNRGESAGGSHGHGSGFHVVEVKLLEVFVGEFLARLPHYHLAFLHDPHAVGDRLRKAGPSAPRMA